MENISLNIINLSFYWNEKVCKDKMETVDRQTYRQGLDIKQQFVDRQRYLKNKQSTTRYTNDE